MRRFESLNKTMLKNQLSGEFEMKDLGVAQKMLGMEIPRDLASYFLSQLNYIEKVLGDFSMQRSKPVSTPLVTHFKNFQTTLSEEVGNGDSQRFGKLFFVTIELY